MVDAQLLQPALDDLIRLLQNYRRYSLAWRLAAARTMNFLFQRRYQRGNIGRLGEVIVHLFADRFKSSLEIGISGENEGGSTWLNSAHGAHQDESIGRSANV